MADEAPKKAEKAKPGSFVAGIGVMWLLGFGVSEAMRVAWGPMETPEAMAVRMGVLVSVGLVAWGLLRRAGWF